MDSLYEKFNLSHPKDFTGHSLSVSDVIVWNNGKETKAYYVDSYGFKELSDFVKQREQGMLSDDFGEENITAEIGNQPKQEGKTENKTLANAEKPKKKTRAEAVKEITEKLEHGLEELFDSEKLKEYLNTMSKF